jgi:membrane-bound serine protease (ClpP class)
MNALARRRTRDECGGHVWSWPGVISIGFLLAAAVLLSHKASLAHAQAAAPAEAAQEPPKAVEPDDTPVAPPGNNAPANVPPANAPVLADAPAKKYQKAVLIRFEGMIDEYLLQYFHRKLKAAEAAGADLLIIEIESPGGLVDASFEIAGALRDVAWARTVAYIPETAYSGAAIVALGCDEIVMASNGHLGDVGVIFISEDRSLVDYVPEKVLSPYVDKIRMLAKSKGRSPALAEAMMDRKVEVHQYRNTRTGEQQYFTEADAKAAGPEWAKGVFIPESRKDKFLTVGGERAIELKLADGLAANRRLLFERYNLDTPPTIMEWTAVDTTVNVLNHPWITALLLIIGLICLYIEFSMPGIGIGGLLAALCFALFFWSRFMGATAGWLEVILFIGGVAFLGVELFLLPGFGVVGLTGLLLMVASVVLASQDFTIPHGEKEMGVLSTNLMVVTFAGVGFLGLAIAVSHYFGTIPVLRSLRLDPPATSLAQGVGNDLIPLTIGASGEAHTALRPGGKANINGRLVDVVAEGTFIDRGQAVEVVEIAGSRVVVREV